MDWQPDYSVVFPFLFLTWGSHLLSPQSRAVTLEGFFSLDNISLFASLNISFSIPWVAILSLVLNPKDIHRLHLTVHLFCEKHKWPEHCRNNRRHSVFMGFFYMSKCCKTTLSFPVMALYLMAFSFWHYLNFLIRYSWRSIECLWLEIPGCRVSRWPVNFDDEKCPSNGNCYWCKSFSLC